MEKSTATPVSAKSEEFRRVQYLLQLALRDFTLSDLCIWNFCNPNQAVEFERRTRNLCTQHSWVDANRLGEGNTLEGLHAKGFNLPQEGMQFNCGDIDIGRNFNHGVGGGAFRFLLCQVGVGRAFVVDEPSEQIRLPPGYDSVYLARPVEDTALVSAGESTISKYHHEYVINDPAQVLPMYLVQFFADPTDRVGRKNEPNGVTNQGFDLNDLNSGIGTQMNPSVQQLYDRYDFFDPVLYVPVSVRDKMIGSHSVGEAAQHKLIAIGDAYDAALSESMKPDPLVAKRQADIRAQLRSVDEKLREVNKNSAAVEEQIYQMLQRALFQLQDSTQEKMSALLAEEVELRRQLQQVEWVEGFLEKEREEASQVEFLNAWKCHVQLRADMTKDKLRTPTILENIHADLSLTGNIEIQKGREIMQSASQQPPKPETMEQVPQIPSTFPPPPPSAAKTEPVQSPFPQPTNGTQPPIAANLNASFRGMHINTQPSPFNGNLSEVPNHPTPFSTNMSTQNNSSFPLSPVSDGDTSASMSTPTPPNMSPTVLMSPNGTESKFKIPGFNEAFGISGTPAQPPPAPEMKAKSFSNRTPKKMVQYSLSAEAKRRIRQMELTLKEVAFISETAFENSRLLSREPLEDVDDETKSSEIRITHEAQALYLCLPFGYGGSLPQLKLLYASWKSTSEKTVEALLDTLPTTSERDEDGNLIEHKLFTPTILVLKSKGQVFGGYVNDAWRSNGECFGSSRCFLFSITKDVKIPFRGRETLPAPEVTEEQFAFENPPTYSAAKSGGNEMQFGPRDLVLRGDFSNCTSELEGSYSIGLSIGSDEAKTFLAGSEKFDVDDVELWAIES